MQMLRRPSELLLLSLYEQLPLSLYERRRLVVAELLWRYELPEPVEVLAVLLELLALLVDGVMLLRLRETICIDGSRRIRSEAYRAFEEALLLPHVVG